jgi:NAD(P)-dependent dehydrogenase (short-subunit alcohol dehydrogenase family)
MGITVDMTDAVSIAAGFATVSERWGRLNSLVHTIGPGDGYFEQMDDTEWEAAFTLGTMSGVRSIRAALPMLRASDWARIVTLSAHSIQRQNPRIVAYTASKAALASITKNLSKSLAKDGILVNCVCPGTIVTASFTEKSQRHPRHRRSRCHRPVRRDDVDRQQLPPALRSRPRRAP